jgi:hypothetical protein
LYAQLPEWALWVWCGDLVFVTGWLLDNRVSEAGLLPVDVHELGLAARWRLDEFGSQNLELSHNSDFSRNDRLVPECPSCSESSQLFRQISIISRIRNHMVVRLGGPISIEEHSNDEQLQNKPVCIVRSLSVRLGIIVNVVMIDRSDLSGCSDQYEEMREKFLVAHDSLPHGMMMRRGDFTALRITLHSHQQHSPWRNEQILFHEGPFLSSRWEVTDGPGLAWTTEPRADIQTSSRLERQEFLRILCAIFQIVFA